LDFPAPKRPTGGSHDIQLFRVLSRIVPVMPPSRIHIYSPHDMLWTIPQAITTSSNLNGLFKRNVAPESIILLRNGTVVPPTDTRGHQSNGSHLKSILGALFFVAFIAITGSVLFMRRVRQLRRAHQPLSKLFTYRTKNPSSDADPTHHCPRTVTVTLTDRRLGFRGLGLGNPLDGALEDKDVLPVYDGAGRPPKYVEYGNGRTGLERESGRVCNGRIGVEMKILEASKTTSPTAAYPDAPPGDPVSISVDDHAPPPPIHYKAER